MKRLLGGVGVFVVLAGILLSFSVSAAESGGIGGRPANPDPSNSRTESIFVFSLDAGSESRNAVRVYNNTDSEKSIAVYAVDSQVSSGGAFACAQKVDEKRNVGSWVSLDQSTVKLAAGTTQTIDFTLKVPEYTPAGEHNGCIVIQELDQTPQAAGNGITLSFRSAIRMAVTVAGDITKELSFTRLELKDGENEKRIVNTALRNTGNVSLDTAIDVRIKSILGFTARQTGGEFPVLAGGESEFNFETTDPFWGGVYLLTAKALYNNDPTSALGTGEKAASVTARKIIFTAPKPLAVVIELTILAAAICSGLLFWRRKQTKQQWQQQGQLYKVKKGDDVQKIAEKHDVQWKQMTRVNNLKPPYLLKVGQELYLPKPANTVETPKDKSDLSKHKIAVKKPAKKKPVNKNTGKTKNKKA
jgi:hypothetical protein